MQSEMKVLTVGGVGVIVLAIIVITGIAICGLFGYSLRTETTAAVNGITVGAVNASTSLGTSYPYVQTITGCVNASDATDTLNAANYTVYNGGTSGGGFILLDGGAAFVGETVNCSSVTYLPDNTVSQTADSFATGLAYFGAFAGILVLIAMAAIIYRLISKNMKN